MADLFASLGAFLGKDIAVAISEIAETADFEMSDAANEPFVKFIEWINPRPAFIAAWRSDPALERKHYLRFMSGLEAARDGYRAAVYHLERLRGMEDQLHAILAKFDFAKSVPPGSVAAIGNARRWSFEYQAFVLAYRRALDSVAWGLSTYFKAEQSSFKQFAKNLAKHHPAPVACVLARACARHIEHFDFVIGTERGRSVRDRIAHRESIQAGYINVGAFGFRIVGGGERLGISDFNDRQRLADVLENRLQVLHACLADILDTFREAVTAYEAEVIVSPPSR
ncbi:hypothetical protein [Novosphingobium colocasiae]|nr:hypothetical protein [Novosphingobium colocasiae]